MKKKYQDKSNFMSKIYNESISNISSDKKNKPKKK